MLKCIWCGKEYPEKINMAQCPSHNYSDKNSTSLYSTSIKNFGFKPSPLELAKSGSSGELWLKREDKNPISGTFKDRKSKFIVSQFRPLALASSGNQAISLAKDLEKHKLIFSPNTYLYVSPHISEKKLEILKKYYYEITFVDRILSTQEIIRGEPTRWNVSNGMDPLGASAYYSLAMELEQENFDYIIVPCGSGELYSSLNCYFHLLRKKSPPIVIPVQSKLKETDAIFTNFVAMQPFIDYFSIKAGGHPAYSPYIIENKTETLKSLSSYSDKYNCELSSAVVFEAYEKLELKGKCCLVITGCKK